jgi:hypothetical protein
MTARAENREVLALILMARRSQFDLLLEVGNKRYDIAAKG